MGYLERIKAWKSLIGSCYSKACSEQDLAEIEASNVSLFSVSPDNAEIGADLEISFREVLGSLLDQARDKEIASAESDVFKLLKFAFSFAVKFQSLSPMLISKLPFVMLEDIMECQTIAKAEAIWQTIESLTDTITHPDIFPKGKLTVLRMCNSLLRKLSKSCNTEFCGRVLMFLAAIYPLSEKSALNLSGKVNTNNMTYFESEAEYLMHAGCGAVVASNDAGTSMTVGETQSDVVAEGVQEEKNSSEHMEVEEQCEEFPDNARLVPEIAYDLYRSFWNLQSFFASDQKTIDSADLWRDFMDHARTVVELFDKFDFTESELDQARAAQNTNDSGGKASNDANAAELGDELAYSGCKYLTSSQLFSLQLRDPIVRQQVAVQILYFVHYIRTKSTPCAPAEILPEVSKDMLFLHDKACALIEHSPNDGTKLLAILKQLLSRENRFIYWKTLACPEIQISRPILSEEELARRESFNLNKSSSNSFALYKKRPQRIKVKRTQANSAHGACGRASLLLGYQFDYSDAHVKTVARDLVQNIPTYEAEIEQYIDAEDPDAGIEEEYHPKHDNLYCWRVRRLMAAQHLSAFEAMADGDIGKGLRKLNNQPEPIEDEEEITCANSNSAVAAGGSDGVNDLDEDERDTVDNDFNSEGNEEEHDSGAEASEVKEDLSSKRVPALIATTAATSKDSRKRKLPARKSSKTDLAEDGEEVE